ncbi:hypothetical protein OAF47_00355 [bacterium]|nr:hypothetical protein [bacterium]
MNKILGMIVTLIAAAPLAGCGGSNEPKTMPPHDVVSITPDGPPPMLDDHGHGSHGPHGGDLIEIGKASFHGELVQTDDQVTMYVLGDQAKASLAINAPEVTVSLKHDGSVQSYILTAAPEPDDEKGNSSRFTSQDPALATALNDGAEGVVIFQVDGKSHTGSISHDHDHAGHSH